MLCQPEKKQAEEEHVKIVTRGQHSQYGTKVLKIYAQVQIWFRSFLLITMLFSQQGGYLKKSLAVGTSVAGLYT
jgi:hypothetical protein